MRFSFDGWIALHTAASEGRKSKLAYSDVKHSSCLAGRNVTSGGADFLKRQLQRREKLLAENILHRLHQRPEHKLSVRLIWIKYIVVWLFYFTHYIDRIESNLYTRAPSVGEASQKRECLLQSDKPESSDLKRIIHVKNRLNSIKGLHNTKNLQNNLNSRVIETIQCNIWQRIKKIMNWKPH